MLVMCGEKSAAILESLAELRADFIRQLIQEAVVGTRQVSPLLKPMLD